MSKLSSATKTPPAQNASVNLLGALLLLSLLSTSLMSVNFNALSDLILSCESQWQHFTAWIGSGMMHPHQ